MSSSTNTNDITTFSQVNYNAKDIVEYQHLVAAKSGKQSSACEGMCPAVVRRKSNARELYTQKCACCDFQSSKTNPKDLARVFALHEKVCKHTGRTTHGHLPAEMSQQINQASKMKTDLSCDTMAMNFSTPKDIKPLFMWNDLEGIADYLANMVGCYWKNFGEDGRKECDTIGFRLETPGAFFRTEIDNEGLDLLFEYYERVNKMCDKLKKDGVDKHNIARRYIKNNWVNNMMPKSIEEIKGY